MRVSHMGDRRAGAANVHTDRDQVEAIRAAVPDGGRLEILPAELDVSGGLPLEHRPSLSRAVEGVERGRFAGIIVAYQSRLFRNVEEEEAVWRRVEAAGGEVVLALENIDNSTVDGRMLRRFKSAMNAAEREAHAERFERLREWATRSGIWQRRQTPRGYVRDPESRRLVADEDADAVRRAFADFVAGAPTTRIADALAMTPSGARQLLRNRVYLGELRVGSHVNSDAHPPLIDIATFEAAALRLDANVRPPRSGEIGLLAGLVRCASCGHVMTRTGAGGDRAYVCPRNHSGARCPAPAAIGCHLIDPYVEGIALAELGRLEIVATEGNRMAKAAAALRGAERNLEAFVERFDADSIGELFDRQLRRRTVAVEQARTQLAEVSAQARLPDAGSAWPKLTAHDRNALLRSLLAAVVVRPVGRGRRVPVVERCRVLRFGADVVLPQRRGGQAAGIVPIPFPDADGEGVLGPGAVEDR